MTNMFMTRFKLQQVIKLIESGINNFHMKEFVITINDV